MVSSRTASRISFAFLVALLVVPASALAATPPVLDAPAAGASSFKEGASMKFEWHGALQGDADTLGRSFFRLEIVKSADMPSGAQTEWTDLENFVPTDPGQAVGELEIGVPSAGTYRWRVCAWGVVDDLVANSIVQLPGGCSASRAFVTSAVADSNQTPGTLKIEEKVNVPGRVETITVTRPDPNATADPEPTTEAPPVAAEPEVVLPAAFSDIVTRTLDSDGSALGLDSSSPLNAEGTAGREGLAGSILDGLTATLPFVPIPFWTLALLLACVPVARAWRASTLAMFDWSDGTIDGSGSYDDAHGDLSSVPLVHALKSASSIADGEASAPEGLPSCAPGRRRRAA